MITWEISLKDQYNRYNYVTKNLKNNFYQKLKFYVLPFLPVKFRNRVIFYPENYQPEIIYNKYHKHLEQLKKNWRKIQKEFLQDLTTAFPGITQLSIKISPSLYGSIGQYCSLNKNQIVIYPRFDRNLRSIQLLLITALVHHFYFPKSKLLTPSKRWLKKQMLAREISTKILGKEKNKSLVNILNSAYSGDLAQKSADYLIKLGYPLPGETKLIRQNLTKEEISLLKILEKNRNKVVCYDDLADALWGEESFDKFSEYAITKLVERLKRKIKSQGIRDPLIHSQRGKGYILYD